MDTNNADPPLKTLKKISEMHAELEETSEKVSGSLQQLRADNEEQDLRIRESLSAIQQEQKQHRKLLLTQWSTQEDNEDSAGDDIRSSKELKLWSVADVIRWLEYRQLHKFIILFQKHHVSGQDLADLKLPFLEDYDHISVEEREVLLAEIYQLLNPESVCVSNEDLSKIKSPLDRQKYLAAVELTQASSGNLLRSKSVVVLPTTRTPSLSSSSNQSSPLVRPRNKSASEWAVLDRASKSVTDINLTGNKKRRTLPNLKIKTCVLVPRLADKTYGVTMTTDHSGEVTVEKVPDHLKPQLSPGDRVVEVNGVSMSGRFQSGREFETLVHTALTARSPVSLVVLRAGQQNSKSEVDADCNGQCQFSKLRSILVDMRDTDMDCDDLPDIPTQKLQEVKDRASLQTELGLLKDKLRQQEERCKELQSELESKSAMMHDMDVSRNKAVEKLKQARNRGHRKTSQERQGGREYYNITMEMLNVESASKEEVVECLKDIVKEASGQKWYLDRLISLVIDEAPWMLDEVDADFDSLTVTGHPE